MVVQASQKMSLDAFTEFAQNADKMLELIDGEVIEVPSNPFASVIAMRIVTFLSMYLLQNAIEGYITGEGGGFIIDGHVFAPDVAYIDALPTNKGYEEKPPLLAVEVISDPHNNTEQTDLRRKMVHYHRAGVVVWVVDYVAEQVEVHQPDAPVKLLGMDATLDGGDVLRGFELPVRDIFPQKKD